MQIPTGRYQLIILAALLALGGLTASARWMPQALLDSHLNPFRWAAKTASAVKPANKSIVTATSAAAETNSLFTSVNTDAEPVAFAPAQAGGSFNITQTVIPGGGGTSTGGNHAATGSIGQSVLGTSSAGNFSVAGGFWGGGGQCSTITVNPMTLPNGQIGVAYSQQLSQTGGTGVITWSSIGTLPNNLTLNPATGLLSGTPTAAGTFNFTVRATDANSCFGERAYTVITGTCPVITISPANLPGGLVGNAYNQTLSATGGTPNYSFTLNSGTLPPNITLATTGVLSGTLSTAGSFTFTVKITDQAGCMATKQYTVNICATITISPSNSTLPAGTVGSAYSQQFTQSGGVGTLVWSNTGTLPNGLNLNTSTGLLSGTPTATGLFNFTIRATDVNGCTGERAYTLSINPTSNGLQFYPLAHPVRLLDTRPGAVGCDGPDLPVSGGTSRTQTAAGRTCDGISIPASARALTGNITTVESGGGYLTLFPSDAAQPTVANSNYLPNEILNNVFTVGLGAGDGAFKIFVTSDTHLVVDVTGYYAPPGAGGLYFHPLPKPIRLLETRVGQTGCFAPGTPIQGGVDTAQQARITCDNVTIPTAARAIVGNATVVNPGGGYLTLFPADAARPLVANSNYSAGQIMNAPFTVGLSPTGEFKIFATSTTDLVIDVLGYYSAEVTDANGAGLLFNPLPHPVRLLETRNNPNFPGCFKPNQPIQGGVEQTQPARGICDGVTITSNALAIVGNATVVNANGGYLTFWPSDAARPLVATSNFVTGRIFNRHFTVGLGNVDGAFKIFSPLTTDLVIDVAGYFAP